MASGEEYLPAATPDPMSVAVFICSSDNRRDILERVLPSVLSYWSDCPYAIYVGVNTLTRLSSRVTEVTATPSDWRLETRQQISEVRATHLIVLLDDFLFNAHVDQPLLTALVSTAIMRDLPYLRLSPLGRSLKQRLGLSVRTHPQDVIEPVAEQRPYYSSLHIALWKKEHFIAMLGLKGSIWDFEHQSIPAAQHFAITGHSPFNYRHVVEKGKWLPYAELLFARAGLSTDLGHRPSWPVWMNLRLLMDDLRFFLFGYANY